MAREAKGIPVNHDLLRQCCAWSRTFLKEAGNELLDMPNTHQRAASQLMILLAELTVHEEVEK